MLNGCTAKKSLDVPVSETDVIVEPEYSYLWVVKQNINIRQENTAGSGKIGELSEGDSVIVHGNSNGWYSVVAGDGTTGWVRSDLLGPRNVSIFRKAVEFADLIKEEQDVELYFDTKLRHRRVYLSLPDAMYSSRNEAERQARQIITEYQKKVYRGDVTVRILQPDSDQEYLTFEQKGERNPEILIPVIPFGFLTAVDDTNPLAVTLSVSLRDEFDNQHLLEAARSMASEYPISFQKVAIKFVSADNACRMWFVEDVNGEMYEFDKCPE